LAALRPFFQSPVQQLHWNFKVQLEFKLPATLLPPPPPPPIYHVTI
jgi:hypothetical protein